MLVDIFAEYMIILFHNTLATPISVNKIPIYCIVEGYSLNIIIPNINLS